MGPTKMSHNFLSHFGWGTKQLGMNANVFMFTIKMGVQFRSILDRLMKLGQFIFTSSSRSL